VDALEMTARTIAAEWPLCALLSVLGTAIGRQSNLGAEDDPMLPRARQFAWHLERAYADAAGASSADLVATLKQLAPDLDELGYAMVAWLKLIEALVQEAERAHGPAPRRGAIKAAQVKAVVVHVVLEGKEASIPGIPPVVLAVVLDVGLDWAIALVVALLNNNDGLWQVAPGAAPQFALSRTLGWILALGNWLARQSFAQRLAGLLQRMILRANPLTPALASALQKMSEDERLSLKNVANSLGHLGAWVATHRSQLTALVQLISVVVQEAQRFVNWSGPEKKQYASDLVLIFLKDIGIIGDGPIADAIARWAVDWAIEFVLDVFKNRGIL
jgi:hypothetical protein